MLGGPRRVVAQRLASDRGRAGSWRRSSRHSMRAATRLAARDRQRLLAAVGQRADVDQRDEAVALQNLVPVDRLAAEIVRVGVVGFLSAGAQQLVDDAGALGKLRLASKRSSWTLMPGIKVDDVGHAGAFGSVGIGRGQERGRLPAGRTHAFARPAMLASCQTRPRHRWRRASCAERRQCSKGATSFLDGRTGDSSPFDPPERRQYWSTWRDRLR